MRGTTTKVRPPSRRLVPDALPRAIEGGRAADPGADRDAALRRGAQVGDVEVGVQDLAERPGDRRRGHEQDVRNGTARLRLEGGPLLDAEPVLLVDDREGQVREADGLGDERVGPHDDAGHAAGEKLAGPVCVGGAHRARQELDLDPERPEEIEERALMLPGQEIGRSQQRALAACDRGRSESPRRDRRLARPDVTLEQPEHRDRSGEVRADRVNGARPGPA